MELEVKHKNILWTITLKGIRFLVYVASGLFLSGSTFYVIGSVPIKNFIYSKPIYDSDGGWAGEYLMIERWSYDISLEGLACWLLGLSLLGVLLAFIEFRIKTGDWTVNDTIRIKVFLPWILGYPIICIAIWTILLRTTHW